MSQDNAQIVASVQKFGKMFPGLFDVFKVFVEISSYEQAAAEAQSRLDRLKKDHAAADAAASERLSRAKAEIEHLYAAARADAETKLAAAKAEAEEKLAAAKTQAQALMTGAEESLKALQAKAALLDHQLSVKADDLEKLQGAVKATGDELAAWQEKLASAQADHGRVQTMITELKAKLG